MKFIDRCSSCKYLNKNTANTEFGDIFWYSCKKGIQDCQYEQISFPEEFGCIFYERKEITNEN